MQKQVLKRKDKPDFEILNNHYRAQFKDYFTKISEDR